MSCIEGRFDSGANHEPSDFHFHKGCDNDGVKQQEQRTTRMVIQLNCSA